MKKPFFTLVFVLTLALCLPLVSQVSVPFAETPKPEQQYALMDSDTDLYSNTSDEPTVLTGLPASYFVEILEDKGDYYAVSYLDIVGFVKKESVTLVDYTPKYQFATPRIQLGKDVAGVNIRTSPDTDTGSVVYTVGKTDLDFIYYGKVDGTEALS
ncbi:MAG: hypothetical protein FWD76_05735, partial [Firmicutes bacterium]|nr:hypothetical protein [Bacillota bacterium]